MRWVRTKRRQGRQSRNVYCQNGREMRPAFIDYKDVSTLKKFMTSQGRIQSRKRTGLSAVYQRALRIAIQRARFMVLVPYAGD
ncbi:MAG: 30S ribosomal protein S18 [Gemmataceae bacterium]|nr:30S ribosomal protein S18 [Gemmataceae bacterium]